VEITHRSNNDWGYGTIDALAAVQAAIAYDNIAGTLQGTVTDAVSGEPIQKPVSRPHSADQTFHRDHGSLGRIQPVCAVRNLYDDGAGLRLPDAQVADVAVVLA